MSEFVDVMLKAKYICARHSPCSTCPLYSVCDEMDHRKTCKHSDIKNFESSVNDWWKKHKPMFHTWQQWQKDKFPESDLFICARSFMSSKEWKAVSGVDCSIAECSRCVHHPIPYRIAAILGV